ncbi:uncharacterized protein YALI1_F03495g [Yarrowia lipolytica]|uniref:Uncharacterized protein n=1 Tax=Yarrowia lipolytica TaxID=4952 RepID=A0A1D8NLM6_YARLL|nr:hypothetical protein YALI1_F03495g [Yarrowia lipolytica]
MAQSMTQLRVNGPKKTGDNPKRFRSVYPLTKPLTCGFKQYCQLQLMKFSFMTSSLASCTGTIAPWRDCSFHAPEKTVEDHENG